MNRPYIRYGSVSILVAVIALVVSGCATRTPSFKAEALLRKDIRNIGGVSYVPLARVCDAYGLDWSWDRFSRVAIVKDRTRSIALREGGATAVVNGSEKKLARPSVLRDGALYVPASFVPELLETSATAVQEIQAAAPGLKRYAIRTVVLDAGHGGEQSGARSRRYGLREKDVTLRIVKKLKARLEERGISVILTRGQDRSVSLADRSRIANDISADLFVSVHANASRTRQAGGFECYYLSEATDDRARALEAAENASFKFGHHSSPGSSRGLDATLWDLTLTENRVESCELAGNICRSANRDLAVKNRGVKAARFYVLKNTRMPGVLVEVGFLTNRHDAMRMGQSGYLDRVAAALAKGILAYKGEYERTNGFTI